MAELNTGMHVVVKAVILDDNAVAEIEARANAATEGPWESDNQQDSEHRYQFYMALTPDGKSIFDTLNSSIGEIHEEADEDGVYRWDETGRKNIAFASHARTDIPALCQTVRALRAALATSDSLKRGYYDEAAKGWEKFREAERQLAAVTQERDEMRAELEGLRYQAMFTDTNVGDD